LASPKSAILASRLRSRRTLLALMSLWMILGVTSKCKYASPRAVPKAMLKRVRQSISIASFGPPVIAFESPNKMKVLAYPQKGGSSTKKQVVIADDEL
jgi:hypothetical protein